MALLNTLLLFSLLWVPFPQDVTPPQVVLVGADAAKVITLDAATSDFEAVLYLEETANQAVTDLELTVTPLQGPEPGQRPLDWSLEKDGGGSSHAINMPALGMVPVYFSARIPAVGEYTASLSLRYAGRRETYTLRLNRKSPTAGFTLEGLPVGPLDMFPLSKNRLPLQIMIAETSGQSLRLYPPVATLSRLDSDDVAHQAALQQVDIVDEDGNPLVLDTDGTFSLSPYEVRSLKVLVTHKPQAGRYNAVVRMQSPDGVDIQADIPVQLRHHWILALLIILGGVLGSLLLRRWRESGRQNTLQALRLASLAEEVKFKALAAGSTTSEVALVQMFQERLQRIRRDLEAGIMPDDAVLEELSARWRCILDLSILSEDVGRLPDDLAIPVEQYLTEARQSLGHWGQSYVTAADAALAKAREAFDAALKTARVRPLEELISSMETYAAGLDDGELKLKLQQTLETAKISLTEVQNGNESAFGPAYIRARRRYLEVLMDDLQTRMHGYKPDGAGAWVGEWETDRKSVEKTLSAARRKLAESDDLDEAEDLYEKAVQETLEALLPSLREKIKSISDKLSTSDEAARDALHKAEVMVARCESHLEQDDVRAAIQDFDAAQDQVGQAEKEITMIAKGVSTIESYSIGNIMRSNDSETETLLPALPVAQAHMRMTATAKMAARPAAEPPVLPTSTELKQRLSRGDWVVAGVISVLSGLVGVQLLWVTNATFGELNDYIAALLWGFGLHELNSLTQQSGGVAAVASVVEGNSPPEA